MRQRDKLESPDGFASVRRTGVATKGRIVVVPPFGIPARMLDFIGDDLATRGYEACLLDVRNHVGGGSGTIVDYRLSTVVDDCRLALRHYEPTGVIGLSLGARALLRATATSGLHPHTVLLIPVVNFRATLTEVLGHDIYVAPEVPEFQPVLGQTVRSEPFLNDALHHGMLSIGATAHDLATLGGHTSLFPLDGDAWIDIKDVHRAAEVGCLQGGPVSVTPVAGEQHELHKDPELALRMVAAAVDEIERLHQLQSTF